MQQFKYQIKNHPPIDICHCIDDLFSCLHDLVECGVFDGHDDDAEVSTHTANAAEAAEAAAETAAHSQDAAEDAEAGTAKDAVKEASKEFACPQCNKLFKNASALSRHTNARANSGYACKQQHVGVDEAQGESNAGRKPAKESNARKDLLEKAEEAIKRAKRKVDKEAEQQFKKTIAKASHEQLLAMNPDYTKMHYEMRNKIMTES